jgi:hypothetical protein
VVHLRIADILSEILTKHLPNRSLQRSRLARPVGDKTLLVAISLVQFCLYLAEPERGMEIFVSLYPMYICIWAQGSSVGVATRLRTGRRWNRNSILSILYNVQTAFGAHPDSYAIGIGALSQRTKAAGA